MNVALFAASSVGIGKGIGLLLVWIDDRLRRHYCGAPQVGLPSAHVELYDRDFIRNLKLETA